MQVFLSDDSYPTISVLVPLFSQIKLAVAVNDDDSRAVKDFKGALAKDMNCRYQNECVLDILNNASFLDPRFKTLAHLSPNEQQETLESILDELVDCCHRSVGERSSSSHAIVEESPAAKKA